MSAGVCARRPAKRHRRCERSSSHSIFENLTLDTTSHVQAFMSCLFCKTWECEGFLKRVPCAAQVYNRLQVMSANLPVPQQQDGSYLTMFSLGGFE
jgi:hypothetical protein